MSPALCTVERAELVQIDAARDNIILPGKGKFLGKLARYKDDVVCPAGGQLLNRK
jgi:hypothetical protein